MQQNTKGKGKAAPKRRNGSPSKMGMAVGLLCLGGAGVAAYEFVGPPTIARGVSVFGTDLSGLTPSEAEKRLEAEWAKLGAQEIKVELKEFEIGDRSLTPAEAGVKFDATAMIKALPVERPVTASVAQMQGPAVPKAVTPVFVYDNVDGNLLKKWVEEARPANQPARAQWAGGRVKLTQEIPTWELDQTRLSTAWADALANNTALVVPLKAEDLKIKPEQLESIRTIVSEFNTKFSSGQVARSKNIKRAAELIDGTILMPGEVFDFNRVVGQRTSARGFHVAGVYVSGRHDFDFGGGICQVSTTLYNAVLLGELKVNARSPHSLPVPYVPLGRDAAVSWPNLDFKFTNDTKSPLAVAAEYRPGQLTFRILGEAKHPHDVSFETKFLGSWDNGVKYETDASLGYGVERVVDRGGAGRRVRTYRIIKNGDQVVRRDDLGESIYRGGPRIVARNPNAKPPQATAPADSSAPAGTAGSPATPPTEG